MQIYDDSFGHLFGPHFLGFLTRPHKLGKMWVVGERDDLLWFSRQRFWSIHHLRYIMTSKQGIYLTQSGFQWDDIHVFSRPSSHGVFFDGVVFLIGSHLHFVTHLFWNLHNKVEYSFTWLQWNVVPRGNLQCCYPKLFVGESKMQSFKDVVFLVSCM